MDLSNYLVPMGLYFGLAGIGAVIGASLGQLPGLIIGVLLGLALAWLLENRRRG
jgi:hypothetical protein